MEQAMQTCSLVVLGLAWIAALAFISRRIRPRKQPPGPFPWPVIGNLHQLGTLPHIKISEWAEIYGDIMKIKYGTKTVVVASSPKWAEEFLKTHDSVFSSRPPLASGKYTGFNYQDMTWAPYGPHWRMARKIYQTELLNPKSLDAFEHIRVAERQYFLSGLYALKGQPVVLLDQIKCYALSALSHVVFSDKQFGDSKDDTKVWSLSEINDMIDEFMILNGVLNVGDWISFLRPFDLQGLVKRMKALNQRFRNLYDLVITDRKKRMEKEGKNFVPKDMVDVLLMLTRQDTDPEIRLTMDGVKALVHDLVPGGTDTAAVSSNWVLQELFRHPLVLEKAREELDRVIGKERWVEESDYINLPYIDAIIKETYRLHPLSPLLAPHLALEDCNVGGYDISKGTVVLINTWRIGRHPDHWEDPQEFKPERFLGEKEIGMTGQNFYLLPFGAGRRRCPGYSLGLKMVRTTVSNMLHGFDWKFPDGASAEDICMLERYGLTTCPQLPVTMIPQPRLPTNLYRPN